MIKFFNIKSEVPLRHIEEFLVVLLKYKLEKDENGHDYFYYFNDHDYLIYSGIRITLEKVAKGIEIEVSISDDFINVGDIEYANFTINMLSRYYQITFLRSKSFSNSRSFSEQIIVRKGAESGCYMAFEGFQFHSYKLEKMLYLRQFPSIPEGYDPYYKFYHPRDYMNTMMLPILVSTLENYLRNTFIALFRYSLEKDKVLKKLSNRFIFDIVGVLDGDEDIYKIIANNFSFQNIHRVHELFRILHNQINFIGIIKQLNIEGQYEGDPISRLIELRHKVIHHAIRFRDYKDEMILEDIMIFRKLVNTFYREICKIFNWRFEE